MIALIRDAIGTVLGVPPETLPEAFVQAVLAAPAVPVAVAWATYEELELLGYR